MKKKSIWAYVLAFCLIVPAIFMFTACNKDKDKTEGHVHTFSKEWTADETHHWYPATCEHSDEKEGYEEHTYGDWSEKTPAGVDQSRQLSRKCTECEYEDVLPFEDTKTNGSYCMVITSVANVSGNKIVQVKILRGTINTGDNVSVDGISGTFSIDKITKNRTDVTTASCGEEVDLTLDTEDGNLDDISNRKSGYLMYQPNTTKAYNKFTAVIKIDQTESNKPLYNNKSVFVNLYGVQIMMSSCKLALPEDVAIAEDGESYVVTLTFESNESRTLWAGMDFELLIDDSGYKPTIASGIILSVISE